MQIKLIWIDPVTGERRQPVLETPIALGREFTLMPQLLEGERVSRIVLADDRVSNYHALIDYKNGELLVFEQNSSTSTVVNGTRLPSSELKNGDRIQIGNCEITISLVLQDTEKCDHMVGFLFRRRCDRTSRIGCSYCEDSQVNRQPYFSHEYSYYPGYGCYDSGYWGSTYYVNRDCYVYDPQTGNVDFTEADNASMDMEADNDFEVDMGAS